jgi:hypothetical protein
MDQREILPQVSDIHNDAGLTDIMVLGKQYKRAKMGTYHNFVNEALYVQGDTTGATVTGSGTATVNTALTAGTSGYVRVGDLVKFINAGGKIGLVIAVTPGTNDALQIQSVDGTTITHVAGEKLSFFSNAYGEKSKAASNRKTGVTKYLNKLQIFREVNTITDVQKASPIEVTYKGQNLVVYKDLYEKAVKLKGDINAAVIMGEMSATSWDDANPALVDPTNSGAVQTTRGLDSYIIGQGGIDDTVASLGTFALADAEDIVNQFVAKKAPKSHYGFHSTAVGMKVSNMLKALGSAGTMPQRMMIQGQSINYDATEWTYGGHKFQLTNLPILDHVEIMGGTIMAKSIYWVPTDRVKTHGEDGGTHPRIQMRYWPHQIASNTGTELIAEWHGGAKAPTGPNGDPEAVWNTYWLTYQGLECLGLQHFGRTRVIS